MDFFKRLEAVSLFCRVQLEMGKETKTPHFQGVIGFSQTHRPKKVMKYMPRAHLTNCIDAMASWEYCGKDDTRLEGPFSHGAPPAKRNKAGDVAERNKIILEMGVVKAVQDGLIPIERFK